ncbi:MAG: hypothetical protein A2284_17815 [Deltaproteobacteria bacterium RIFOXYA12_FULL_61_11]|nr:MAG: hypothetical protein A2284_17815 [Deltaproteobacteria bacterium RIFOXYA12_FULL_61_11]
MRERCSAAEEGKTLLALLIGSLSEDPQPVGCEKLSGQERYCLRQGDYRILYEIEEPQHLVTVVKVGHRREAYKRRDK